MKYRLPEGTSLEIVDGETVLVANKGDIAILNETGAFVLNELLHNKTTSAAAMLIFEDYAVEVEHAEETISSFVNDLIKSGFIEEFAQGIG